MFVYCYKTNNIANKKETNLAMPDKRLLCGHNTDNHVQ